MILSVLALLPVAFGGQRATWTLEVTADLTPSVPEVPVFRVLPQPLVELDVLRDIFGLSTPPIEEDDFGGVTSVNEETLHALVFANGGAHYIDELGVSSEAPMRPRPVHELWLIGDLYLEDLGLSSAGPYELLPASTGEERMWVVDALGRTHGPWITHQSVHYQAWLDEWPVFGPGGEVEIVWASDGTTAMVSHGLRTLEVSATMSPISAAEAVARYEARARDEGHYNGLLLATEGLQRVVITEIELGYFLPPAGADVDILEPVYRFSGVVYGSTEAGDLLWYESASPTMRPQR